MQIILCPPYKLGHKFYIIYITGVKLSKAYQNSKKLTSFLRFIALVYGRCMAFLLHSISLSINDTKKLSFLNIYCKFRFIHNHEANKEDKDLVPRFTKFTIYARASFIYLFVYLFDLSFFFFFFLGRRIFEFVEKAFKDLTYKI